MHSITNPIKCTIYALYIEEGHYDYVGQTIKTAQERWMGHRNGGHPYGNRFQRWLHEHREQLKIKVLEECDTNDGDDRERHWIYHLRMRGHNLLNVRDGGTGMDG